MDTFRYTTVFIIGLVFGLGMTLSEVLVTFICQLTGVYGWLYP